jgi:hypothetical protein
LHPTPSRTPRKPQPQPRIPGMVTNWTPDGVVPGHRQH